jgi:hypothetical protein
MMSVTCVVLYPLAFRISMPTASRPLKSARSRCSSVPSSTVAICPSRMICPSRSATTSRAKSAGVSSRPLSRMARSSSAPLSRPTGAARFCASSAWTTWATLIPAACMSAGRTCTVSSRSSPPTTVTCATPGTVRRSRTIMGSASRVRTAVGTCAEVRASESTDCCEGSNRVRTGSSISVGRSARWVEIASRMSCEASWTSFSKSKKTTNWARPSVALACVRDQSTPLIVEKASSIGSTISRSTVSGEAPG